MVSVVIDSVLVHVQRASGEEVKNSNRKVWGLAVQIVLHSRRHKSAHSMLCYRGNNITTA